MIYELSSTDYQYKPSALGRNKKCQGANPYVTPGHILLSAAQGWSHAVPHPVFQVAPSVRPRVEPRPGATATMQTTWRPGDTKQTNLSSVPDMMRICNSSGAAVQDMECSNPQYGLLRPIAHGMIENGSVPTEPAAQQECATHQQSTAGAALTAAQQHRCQNNQIMNIYMPQYGPCNSSAQSTPAPFQFTSTPPLGYLPRPQGTVKKQVPTKLFTTKAIYQNGKVVMVEPAPPPPPSQHQQQPTGIVPLNRVAVTDVNGNAYTQALPSVDSSGASPVCSANPQASLTALSSCQMTSEASSSQSSAQAILNALMSGDSTDANGEVDKRTSPKAFPIGHAGALCESATNPPTTTPNLHQDDSDSSRQLLSTDTSSSTSTPTDTGRLQTLAMISASIREEQMHQEVKTREMGTSPQEAGDEALYKVYQHEVASTMGTCCHSRGMNVQAVAAAGEECDCISAAVQAVLSAADIEAVNEDMVETEQLQVRVPDDVYDLRQDMQKNPNPHHQQQASMSEIRASLATDTHLTSVYCQPLISTSSDNASSTLAASNHNYKTVNSYPPVQVIAPNPFSREAVGNDKRHEPVVENGITCSAYQANNRVQCQCWPHCQDENQPPQEPANSSTTGQAKQLHHNSVLKPLESNHVFAQRKCAVHRVISLLQTAALHSCKNSVFSICICASQSTPNCHPWL